MVPPRCSKCYRTSCDAQAYPGGTSTSNVPDTGKADTLFLFVPGVEVAALKSADGKVELYGELDIGLGRTVSSQTPDPMGPQPDRSNFHLTYLIGPGLRYWVVPQFGVGALAGLHGDFDYQSQTVMGGMGSISSSNTSLVTSVVAELNMLGVF